VFPRSEQYAVNVESSKFFCDINPPERLVSWSALSLSSLVATRSGSPSLGSGCLCLGPVLCGFVTTWEKKRRRSVHSRLLPCGLISDSPCRLERSVLPPLRSSATIFFHRHLCSARLQLPRRFIRVFDLHYFAMPPVEIERCIHGAMGPSYA
jgi:hypothetical protein